MSEERFETHALVELFGHVRLAGKVTEQTIAGTGFIRVDVPDTKRKKGFTRLFGTSAIYSMTPVSEEIAQALAEQIYIENIVPIERSRPLIENEKRDDDDETEHDPDHPF